MASRSGSIGMMWNLEFSKNTAVPPECLAFLTQDGRVGGRVEEEKDASRILSAFVGIDACAD